MTVVTQFYQTIFVYFDRIRLCVGGSHHVCSYHHNSAVPKVASRNTKVSTIVSWLEISSPAMPLYRKAPTIPLDIIQDAVTNGTGEISQQVYEEIGDVSHPPSSTRDVKVPQGQETAAGAAHAYEDVKLDCLQEVADQTDSYHITLCSAYSVSLEHGGQ